VFADAGLDLSAYRPAPLLRRVPSLRRGLRKSGQRKLKQRSETTPLDSALDSLLIGHTGAFRDAEVFQFLRTQGLAEMPELPWRVLSLGCSTGSELLSAAVLLAECGRLAGAHLQGVDIRPSAIRAARRQYRTFWEQIPEPFAELRELARSLEVIEQFSQIDWRVADALRFEADPTWQIVLCRNLSIYLDPRAAALLWQRLAASVAPGGLLIVGKAERPGVAGFRQLSKCVFRKQQDAA
jgi:chemotaxis methyl-accepting protein methylase